MNGVFFVLNPIFPGLFFKRKYQEECIGEVLDYIEEIRIIEASKRNIQEEWAWKSIEKQVFPCFLCENCEEKEPYLKKNRVLNRNNIDFSGNYNVENIQNNEEKFILREISWFLLLIQAKQHSKIEENKENVREW